jgi:hypothetical protein
MELGRAFTVAFEDKEWVSKLVMTVIMVLVSVIPIFGLLAVCALLGYVTDIIHNVRNGHPRPLPKWVDYGDLIIRGAYVLLAWFIYNLPVLLIVLLLYTFSSAIGASLFGSLAYVMIAGCALPLLFVYTVIAWSMLAVGMIHYSETGDNGVFYRFGKLFRVLQNNLSLTLQWVFYSIVSNILFSLLIFIPCIGWIAVLALVYPVQGHLIGQYGRMLGASEQAFREGKLKQR